MVTTIGALSLTSLSAIVVLLVSLSNAADFESDLHDFTALIPRRRIGFIAARHFVLDTQFRRALIFIRDPAFTETWQQIRKTPEFQNIMTYVTSSVTKYDVRSAVDTVPNHLRAFQIPDTVPVDMMFSKTFTSFLREIVDALPRAKVANLMARKVKENGEFARLYKALKSKKCRELVNTARHSSKLAAPLRKWMQNSINVDDIIEKIYYMLNWGP